MGGNAKSAKTCLAGLAVGGSLALLVQMGFITLPSALAPGGSLEAVGGSLADLNPLPQEAGPVDFSMYEIPTFMTAIYDRKFGETGMKRDYSVAYAIKVADNIRQSCRGPFTTAQIKAWEDKVMRSALRQVTPENGLKILEERLGQMAEIYKNPEALADMHGGMPSAEELPMKAQQDVMSFVQDHTCNGPVFDRFTTNLAEAAQMETVAPEDQPKM